MKFTINKTHLIKVLEMANTIINENNINIALTNVLIEADFNNNSLICTFTNESISVRSIINEKLKIEKNGKVLIKVKILKGIISKLQNGDITLEKVDNNLRITNETFDAHINCLDDSMFIKLDFEWDTNLNFKMNNTVLSEIQKKLSHCLLSKMEKQAILNGVYFDNVNEPGIINLVATDSYKVALLKKPFNAPSFKVVVDHDFIIFINQFAETNEEIEFALTDTKIMARWKNNIVSSKLIIGTYPNIYNVFNVDEGETSEFLMNAKDFYNIIEHGMFLVNSEKTPSMRVLVKNENLEVSFKSLEIGSSYEKIEIKNFKGKDIDFIVNAKFMSSILKAFEDHNIRTYFSAPNKPIIFADVIEKDFLQLVLPMRSV